MGNHNRERMQEKVEVYRNEIIEALNCADTLISMEKAFSIDKHSIMVWIKLNGFYDQFAKNRKERDSKRCIERNKIYNATHKPESKRHLDEALIKDYRELQKEGLFISQVWRKLSQKHKIGYCTFWKLRKYLEGEFGDLPKNSLKGELNGMYGKPPPVGSGKGCTGWVQLNEQWYLFRSALELMIFDTLTKKGIQFSSSSHRISYKKADGRSATYQPDLVIENSILEIKPYRLKQLENNLEKSKALENFCKKFGLKSDTIDEFTYDLTPWTEEQILLALESNQLRTSKIDKLIRSMKIWKQKLSPSQKLNHFSNKD